MLCILLCLSVDYNNARKFLNKSYYSVIVEVPNVVGAIDCTHVPVKPPKENREQYINRDGYFSLNVQCVVDHQGAVTH